MITSSRVPPIAMTGVASAVAARRAGGGLLCVANFPSNTGYAWDFIESLYAALADCFEAQNVTTWVAYPEMSEPPRSLRDSAAVPLELDVRLDSVRGLADTLRFVRRNRIRAVYLADRPGWDPAYILLRLAGVRWIVVHDHTSGSRTVPRGVKRLLKRTRGLVRAGLADRVVAVSDFVAKRNEEVDLIPRDRVVRIWNSRPVTPPDPTVRQRLAALVPQESGAIVACACRATREKGVQHLFRAFDRFCSSLPLGAPCPTLVYFGDGPAMPELRELHDQLRFADRIVLARFRQDASELLAGADVCVVPSVWEEAFGLAALEPMTHGVPVIASRVGGIPEIVVEGETGLLTEPGDEVGLESALRRLLSDTGERERLGRNARERAATRFSPDAALRDLARVFEPAFREDPARGRAAFGA